MKTCRRCNESLPLTSFGRHNGYKDGKFIWCKECRSKYRKEAYLIGHPDRVARVAAVAAGIDPSTIYKDKLCIDCLEIKPVSHFHRKRSAKDGKCSYCITCGLVRSTNWAAKNKDRSASSRLAWRQRSPRQSLNVSLFGALKRRPCRNPASLDDLIKIWEEQEGLCALSGIKMTWAQGKLLPTSITLDRIDHNGNYTTDNIRLLCHAVNAFRGRMSDTEMLIMARAIIAKADADNPEPTWNSYLQPLPCAEGFLSFGA